MPFRRLAAVLVADIAGYSRLVADDEEGTLASFRQLRVSTISPLVELHAGRVVKTTGDGFLAEFSNVLCALRCAVDLQARMAELGAATAADRRIEFRIGIHQDEIVVDDSDIYGDGVNIATRLEGLADVGGILVSARVQEDAAGRIALSFEDLGERTLKNMPRPVRVFRVARTPDYEPTAASLQLAVALRGGASGALAAEAFEREQIVGRRQELVQIGEHLARPDCRMLIILGPGGIGKTALARAALPSLRMLFPAVPAWVELEPLADAGQVPSQIAEAIGLSLEPHDQGPWGSLAQALRAGGEAPRLLALDNLEHLPLAAELEELLASVPGLRLLATSRIGLGVTGERRLLLGGLPLPDEDETDADALRANDAVNLFERCARTLFAAFNLKQEAADVVRLVHEVEGMPLAIRLLAAWRRLMPVREIRAELAASLDLLDPSTPQDRSVRAAFERSWQQLGAVEQRVLAHLALLPQRVGRDMLRDVLGAPLGVLASLCDRSLVRADGDGRFSLHPLIRRCAEPHATDAPDLLARHARHMAQRLARLVGESRTSTLAAMREEIEHARAAWRWAIRHGDVAALHDLCGPLAQHDGARGRIGEGLAPLREAATLLDACARSEAGAGPATRALARVLAGMAAIEFGMGDLQAAETSAQSAVTLSDGGLNDREIRADGLMVLYSVHWQRGELGQAATCIERYQACVQGSGDRLREAHGHTVAGLLHSALGRYEDALRCYEAAEALHKATGETASLPTLLSNKGSLLRKMQRPGEAVLVLEEGLDWAQRLAAVTNLPALLTNLGLAQEELGQASAAVTTLERAVQAAREHGEPYTLALALLGKARVLARRDGDLPAALRPVWEALRIVARPDSGVDGHQCLIAAARIAAHCRRTREAAAILRWVETRPNLPAATSAALRRAVGEVGLDPVALEAADTVAAGFGADATVGSVLARLAAEPQATRA